MNNGIKTARLIALAIIIIVAGFYIYDLLNPEGPLDKMARIIHLEDRLELSARLKNYLEDPNPAIRSRAALAVGRIGGKGSAQPLLPLLTDSSWDVAATAAEAIGFTREKEIAATLLDQAADLPPVITARAVESAGRLADSSQTEVVNTVLGLLQHPSPDVREAAVMALFRMNAKAEAETILTLMKAEPDEVVRQRCLYVLARFKYAPAREQFEEYLADPDPFLRSTALRGMGAVKDDESRRYLTIALNDGDEGVVATAIAQLAAGGDNALGHLLVRKLESEKDERLIVALINALQQLDSPQGVAAAQEAAARYRTENITAAAVTYAASIQKGRAINYIDSLLREDGPRVRAACAEALGTIRQQNNVPRLVILSKDTSPMVRASAFTTLMTVDSGNADLYLQQALDDTDFVLNSLACDQIAALKAARYLPELRKTMTRGAGVKTDLRRSITAATRPFLESEPPDSNAMAILMLALKDENYIVRREGSNLWDELLSVPKPTVSMLAETRISERKIRSALEKYATNPYATIVTSRGEVEIELFFDVAPLTVLNFISLAEDGFYNDLTFHRVIPNFVVQGGDPRGDGWGDPGYYIRDEYSDEPYVRGTLGIATSGRDTGGSQFFFTLSPQPHLEGRYTVFGQVLYGMDAVDLIVVGDEIETIHIQEGKS